MTTTEKRGRGRPKMDLEITTVRFEAGTIDRIAAVSEHYGIADFIRKAVAKALQSAEKAKKQS